jgi:hypothetical protein
MLDEQALFDLGEVLLQFVGAGFGELVWISQTGFASVDRDVANGVGVKEVPIPFLARLWPCPTLLPRPLSSVRRERSRIARLRGPVASSGLRTKKSAHHQ